MDQQLESTSLHSPDLPDDVIMRVSHLVKEFPITKGVFFKSQVGAVQAVTDISFEVKKGETLGLVGESGCGKSTTARSVMRLLEPTSGDVWFRSGTADKVVNVVNAPKDELRAIREDIQIVFQDPYASLNPRMTVASIIAEPLTVHGAGTQTRSFCFVSDTVEGLFRLLMCESPDAHAPVNIGNPDEVTIGQLAEEIVAATGAGSELVYVGAPTDDPTSRCPDIARARELLDWQPTVSRADGLARTIDYFRALFDRAPK
jgi:ABC-type dipeptide/oligopeptide/nickel transport system ATPase component